MKWSQTPGLPTVSVEKVFGLGPLPKIGLYFLEIYIKTGF